MRAAIELAIDLAVKKHAKADATRRAKSQQLPPGL
jgi:hypothetical protein